MQTENLLYAEKISAYPGEYTPNRLKFQALAEELSKPHEGACNPADNIFETPEYYKIEIAAPGLKREDLFVSINDRGCLSVSALHKESDRISIDKYHKHSFNYECFTREFKLPENIDTDFVKAEYRSGILSIWFLKTEKPYQRRASVIIVY